MSGTYSDKQIKFIQELRKEGLEYTEIAAEFAEEFGEKRTAEAMRKTFNRYKLDELDVSDDTLFDTLKGKRRTDVNNSRLRKQRQVLTDYAITVDDLLVEFEETVKKINKSKFGKVAAVAKKKGKTRLIPEMLVSDIHLGLNTETYNEEVAKRRMQYYCESFLKELKRKEKIYDVEKIMINFIGDLIQSNSMHKDSGAACNLTNAQQIAIAIEVFFFDLVLPVAKLGHQVDIIGMSGNHDRERHEKFTVNPGTSYYSYTIYKGIEMLIRQSGFKNVSIEIPNECYHVYTAFGSNFLLEHGDQIKGKTTQALENQLARRQNQFGNLLSGIRIGHYHEDLSGAMGRYIINGSSVSDDHYGNLLGYVSRSSQTINFYVDTDRDSSYYHSFVVDLSKVK